MQNTIPAIEKANGSFSISQKVLIFIVSVISLYIGFLPSLSLGLFIVYFIDITNIVHIFFIPIFVFIILLVFIVSEVFIAGLFIIGFRLKYSDGEYDVNSNDKNLMKMCLYYSLYRFSYKLIDIVNLDILRISFLKFIGLKIGKNSRIGTNEVNIMDPCLTEIGENSYLGAYSILTAHVIERGKIIFRKIKIGNNCIIGGETSILPGVIIEDDVMIGSRSLVLKNQTLKQGKTYIGSPVKEVKY